MTKKWHSIIVCAAAALSCHAFAICDNSPSIHFLRTTLRNANPALSSYQVQKAVSTKREPPSVSNSSFLEPTIRAIRFWRHVGPIVLHYKFTELWFKVAHVDSNVRREKWEKLHSLHAQTGLRVILDLRGLFVKIGQVSLLTLI
jgi:hypothetical protein